MDSEEYFTTGVVAKKFNVTRQTVRTWVKKGWLTCDHIRINRLYFTAQNIADFFDTWYSNTTTCKPKLKIGN